MKTNSPIVNAGIKELTINSMGHTDKAAFDATAPALRFWDGTVMTKNWEKP